MFGLNKKKSYVDFSLTQCNVSMDLSKKDKKGNYIVSVDLMPLLNMSIDFVKNYSNLTNDKIYEKLTEYVFSQMSSKNVTFDTSKCIAYVRIKNLNKIDNITDILLDKINIFIYNVVNNKYIVLPLENNYETNAIEYKETVVVDRKEAKRIDEDNDDEVNDAIDDLIDSIKNDYDLISDIDNQDDDNPYK